MKLPSIYKNNSKPKDNNKTSCYVVKENNREVEEVLFSIFNNKNKPKVLIETKNKTYKTVIIAKTKTKITTIENEDILIQDIIDIKRLDQPIF